MNSRISIDVNESNDPIIIIDYYPSSDLRDKFVKRFLEGFNYGSTRAEFMYIQSSDPVEANSKAYLKPISKEIPEFGNLINTPDVDNKSSIPSTILDSPIIKHLLSKGVSFEIKDEMTDVGSPFFYTIKVSRPGKNPCFVKIESESEGEKNLMLSMTPNELLAHGIEKWIILSLERSLGM